MPTAIYPDEALAIARLRQWSYDRLALASARATSYERQGWQKRNTRQFNAQLVRVIDFGRALATLDADEQAALILAYRDRECYTAIAAALHCSERKLADLIPGARQKLARVLDRLNLL